MKISKSISPVTRAIGVFSAVAIVAGGATYAALSSSVTLTDNSLASANSNLKIWDGDSFENTAPGFAVTGLIPGEFSAKKFFYFQNLSDAGVDVSASIPEVEGTDDDPILIGVEPEDVTLRFDSLAPGCSDAPVVTTLAALRIGSVELPCNELAKNAQGNSSVEATEGNYTVEFRVDNVTGDSVSVNNIDLTFTGVVASSSTTESVAPTSGTPE